MLSLVISLLLAQDLTITTPIPSGPVAVDSSTIRFMGSSFHITGSGWDYAYIRFWLSEDGRPYVSVDPWESLPTITQSGSLWFVVAPVAYSGGPVVVDGEILKLQFCGAAVYYGPNWGAPMQVISPVNVAASQLVVTITQ
jgi:hypothetical protein